MKVKLGNLEDNGGLLQCTKFDSDRSREVGTEAPKIFEIWRKIAIFHGENELARRRYSSDYRESLHCGCRPSSYV